MPDLSFDKNQALARLMRFLAVEGVTGQEEAIGQAVVATLIEAGVPRRAIRFDKAHEKIPLPTQTGNLIVTLPGTDAGPPRLFMTHLDTVPLCAGAKPKRQGGRIVPAEKTALGGDNRTGCACLVTLAATLLEKRLPHPPLTLLFTVREESGLWGAHYVDPKDLGDPVEGFNIDGRSATEFTIGAVGAERWEVEIVGKASHAGVHPEQGISATMVGALALAWIFQEGCFGKIDRLVNYSGTSNIGSFGGHDGRSAGEATNVVTDYARLRGEVRSHQPDFVRRIIGCYRQAFETAATKVRDDQGRQAKIKFRSRRDYHAFRLKEKAPVVLHALQAAEQAGMPGTLRISNGGLDANWLVRHGIPTVTFGAGQNKIHTVEEFVEISDFLAGCRMALALATL